MDRLPNCHWHERLAARPMATRVRMPSSVPNLADHDLADLCQEEEQPIMHSKRHNIRSMPQKIVLAISNAIRCPVWHVSNINGYGKAIIFLE